MPTFSPTIALVSVVFPALGRPTRATKPLRCGICSGGVTRTSLPPGADGIAAPGRGTVDTRRPARRVPPVSMGRAARRPLRDPPAGHLHAHDLGHAARQHR